MKQTIFKRQVKNKNIIKKTQYMIKKAKQISKGNLPSLKKPKKQQKDFKEEKNLSHQQSAFNNRN